MIDIINVYCHGLFLIHSKYCIIMFRMSINFISVLHTSWMIPREVDPVQANQYKKLIYISFDSPADDDVATILSSFREMKETSKIRLSSSPPASICLVYLHPNGRPCPAHLHASFYFSHIVLLIMHPPPPCLCGLRKWSQLVVIITSISNNKLKLLRWMKKNMEIS